MWLAWVQVPSLSCSHVLGTHEFPRDTLGTTGPSSAFSLLSPTAHFLQQSSQVRCLGHAPGRLLGFLKVPLTQIQEH